VVVAHWREALTSHVRDSLIGAIRSAILAADPGSIRARAARGTRRAACPDMKLDKPTQDDNQGEADRAAARHGPRPTRISLDELIARGHTVIDRMEALVRRIAGRLDGRSGRR
jgi:hypothetical protein